MARHVRLFVLLTLICQLLLLCDRGQADEDAEVTVPAAAASINKVYSNLSCFSIDKLTGAQPDALNKTVSWMAGYFVIGCFTDSHDQRDLTEGPVEMGDKFPQRQCALYCAFKDYKFAGLQVDFEAVAINQPSTRRVLCYCGLTAGRYGNSKHCTEKCDAEECGNVLTNTVMYIFKARPSSFKFSTLPTASAVLVAALIVVAVVMATATVFIAHRTRRAAAATEHWMALRASYKH